VSAVADAAGAAASSEARLRASVLVMTVWKHARHRTVACGHSCTTSHWTAVDMADTSSGPPPAQTEHTGGSDSCTGAALRSVPSAPRTAPPGASGSTGVC